MASSAAAPQSAPAGGARKLAAAAPMMLADDMAATEAAFADEAPAPQAAPSGGDPRGEGRKLVTTGSLQIRLDDLASGGEKLDALMQSYQAYPASTNVSDNNRYYSIRVPQTKYEAFVQALMGIGKVLNYSENVEDVTLRYYDLESRLESKRELLETYRAYLAKAESMQDILDVEGKIADLQNEIDRTGTEFRNLSNQVDYSTLNLELLGPVAATNYPKETLGERIKTLFAGIGDAASAALVVLIGIVIYGIPALIILALLYWLLLGRIGLLKKAWRVLSGKK
jgi:hypothetical protein